MKAAPEPCARELLEAVPLVMRFIRCYIRQHAAAGLILPQYRTLNFISRLKAPSLSDAAGHLGISLPAMSRLVNDLVRLGWIERRPVATNRRQLALGLTAAGRDKLESVRAAIRRRLAERLGSLSAADRAAVRQAMRALRAAFEAPPANTAKVSGGKP